MLRIFFYEDKSISQERVETFYIQKIFNVRYEHFFQYIIVEVHDYILKDEKDAWRFEGDLLCNVRHRETAFFIA